jgi:hypothetical protein
MKKQQIQIIGRKWFDRTYGNTYHTVEVYVNNKFIAKSPITYGYGDHFVQTAFEILQEKGIFKKTGERLGSGIDKDFYEFQTKTRRDPGMVLISCTDVTRKRDL